MRAVSRLYVDANILIHLVEHSDGLSAALTDLFTINASPIDMSLPTTATAW